MDHGTWMCLVNDKQDFNTVKEFITLNVGVKPKTGVTVKSLTVHNEAVVEAMEGDNIDVLCYARQGYPGAEIDWLVPETENGSYLTVSKVLIFLTTTY